MSKLPQKKKFQTDYSPVSFQSVIVGHDLGGPQDWPVDLTVREASEDYKEGSYYTRAQNVQLFYVKHNTENLKALDLVKMQCCLLRDNTLSLAVQIKSIQGLLLRPVRGGGAHFAELSFPSWATVLIYTHRWALATGGRLS